MKRFSATERCGRRLSSWYPACTPAEAEAFTAKAAELIAKYGVDQALLAGVDPSEAMIEAARKANPEADYRVADGTELPFEDGSFDLAFAVCVLHHVAPPDRPAFVAELARVTRPGGLTVVFEHNPLNPLTRLAVRRCTIRGRLGALASA